MLALHHYLIASSLHLSILPNVTIFVIPPLHHLHTCPHLQVCATFVIPCTYLYKEDSDRIVRDSFCATWASDFPNRSWYNPSTPLSMIPANHSLSSLAATTITMTSIGGSGGEEGSEASFTTTYGCPAYPSSSGVDVQKAVSSW